jgi:hypothetical protein
MTCTAMREPKGKSKLPNQFASMAVARSKSRQL